MKQPEPIDIKILVRMNDQAVMYSMMDEFSLRRLRKFIDELIEWKAAGNACHIGTYAAIITEKRDETQT